MQLDSLVYLYNMYLMERGEKDCFSDYQWWNSITSTRKTNLVKDTSTKMSKEKMNITVNKMI